MKFSVVILLCLVNLMLTASADAAKKATPVCVDKIHVIKGCAACETMMAWLKQGGVKLEITHVEQGAYSLYPSVVYSDKYVDHGDRMYRQDVAIPGKICIISCSIGTN